MAEFMSPLVAERIWALPVSPASVKFLCYLVHRSEYGGALKVRQPQMGAEFGVTKQAVSQLMAPLCDLNIVLRPTVRSYRLHPFAAKYKNQEQMDAAFLQAMEDIQGGDLTNVKLPQYHTVPPAQAGRLEVA